MAGALGNAMARDRRLRLELGERRELKRWARQAARDPRRAQRARLILALARGGTVREVAERIGVHPETVVRWRRRFEAQRLDGILRIAPRRDVRASEGLSGAYLIPPTPDAAPLTGSTRWATRSLARALRVNATRDHRVWKRPSFVAPTRATDVPTAPTSRTPEVVGVYLEGPAAVAFRIPGAPEPPSPIPIPLPLDLLPTAPDRSSAYRVGTSFRSSLGLLTTLDRLRESTPPSPENPDWASPELLVFLRSLSDEGSGPAEIHVFFDRSLPVGSERLDDWVADHPEVRFHDPRPGETWTVAIDRWLRSGPLRSALEDRLALSPRFEEVVERVTPDAAPDDEDRSD
jgi:transcriptional regulator with XRE-family HTH domain